MRKRIIPAAAGTREPSADSDWLDLAAVAEVEITSEDPGHPVESALLPDRGSGGWQAAGPGEQMIRLVFTEPQSLHRIWLEFDDPEYERTQEFVLRWSPDGGRTRHDIRRQQWNFSPTGATQQTADVAVELTGVTVLELSIIPDISAGPAPASLARLRVA